MTEGIATELKALQGHVQARKAALELLRDGYDGLEAPDPGEALRGGSGTRLMGMIFETAKIAQFRAENDIEVMATMIATLDKVIELVEDGRDEEAKALFGAISDLGPQFSHWPERPA